MKKLLLASLFSVFAIFGAYAEEGYVAHDPDHWRVRMDSNPLYRPIHNRWYSITTLGTDTDLDYFALNEELGYGISDRVSIFINSTGSYDSSDFPRNDTKFAWDNLQLGLSWRYVDKGPWIADLYLKGQQRYQDLNDGFEVAAYNWTAKTVFGFVGWDRWTVALSAQADYIHDDLDNVDISAWGMDIGIDALWNFTQHWNVVGGLHYGFNLDGDHPDYVDDPLTVKLGFDYNCTDWSYFGIYAFKDVKHDFDEAPLGFGLKFGIDF